MTEKRYKDHIRGDEAEPLVDETTRDPKQYKNHIRTEDAEQPVDETTTDPKRYKDHIRSEEADRPDTPEPARSYKDYIRTDDLSFSERRERFFKEMHEQLDVWDQRMKRFEADMIMANEQTQQVWRATADSLRDRRNTLSNRLEQMANATEEAWDELSDGASSAWRELSDSMSAAEKRFQETRQGEPQ
jgi:hypothetical protein